MRALVESVEKPARSADAARVVTEFDVTKTLSCLGSTRPRLGAIFGTDPSLGARLRARRVVLSSRFDNDRPFGDIAVEALVSTAVGRGVEAEERNPSMLSGRSWSFRRRGPTRSFRLLNCEAGSLNRPARFGAQSVRIPLMASITVR